MSKKINLIIILGLVFILEAPICAFMSASQKLNLKSAVSDCGGNTIAATTFKALNSIGQNIISQSNHSTDTALIGIISTYRVKSVIKISAYSINSDTSTNNFIISGSSKYCKISDCLTIYSNNILHSEFKILSDNLLWSGTVGFSSPLDTIVVKITDNIKRTAYDTINIRYIPIIFSVSNPVNNSIIYDYTPNFIWNGNGDSYLIIISKDSFSTIYESNIVTDTKFHEANIETNWYPYNNNYQWKVITYKSSNYSVSQVYTFRIEELIGDFDNNNFVDDTDLILLKSHWYYVPENSGWDLRYDISAVNPLRIDYKDLVLFSKYWLLGHRE